MARWNGMTSGERLHAEKWERMIPTVAKRINLRRAAKRSQSPQWWLDMVADIRDGIRFVPEDHGLHVLCERCEYSGPHRHVHEVARADFNAHICAPLPKRPNGGRPRGSRRPLAE